MPIRFPCSECGAKLKAPDGAQGKRIRCPKCQSAQLVPQESVVDSAADSAPEAPMAPPPVRAEAPAAPKPPMKPPFPTPKPTPTPGSTAPPPRPSKPVAPAASPPPPPPKPVEVVKQEPEPEPEPTEETAEDPLSALAAAANAEPAAEPHSDAIEGFDTAEQPATEPAEAQADQPFEGESPDAGHAEPTPAHVGGESAHSHEESHESVAAPASAAASHVEQAEAPPQVRPVTPHAPEPIVPQQRPASPDDESTDESAQENLPRPIPTAFDTPAPSRAPAAPLGPPPAYTLALIAIWALRLAALFGVIIQALLVGSAFHSRGVAGLAETASISIPGILFAFIVWGVAEATNILRTMGRER